MTTDLKLQMDPEQKFRPSCALDPELKPGLKTLVARSGARFFSNLVEIMATEPERFADLIAPLVKEVSERPGHKERRQHRRKQIANITRGLSLAEIEAAVAAVKSRKEA